MNFSFELFDKFIAINELLGIFGNMILSKNQFYVIVFIILALAIARIIPHPPNFTPILGMAVFSGTFIGKKTFAYLIPLVAMFLSDLYLGFHSGMPIIYFSLA